jgi:hypothetical protein
LAWKKNNEHLVVKVILELHVAVFSFVLQILPMLSMLLSMEELESLLFPYFHVFENLLHSSFPLLLSCPSTSSYYHQVMVPILHRSVITNYHAVLVVASSSTDFILLPEQKMY